MDALDGRVARLMKVESDLGVEMDSLCDLISFCLAPAFLVYLWSLRDFGFIGIIIGALFLLCGVLRLARFNLIHDEQINFFIGLPTTVAGCFVAIVLLNVRSRIYEPWFPFAISLLLIFLSWLMISSIKFPAFKRGKLRLKRHYHIVAAIVAFTFVTVMRLELLLLILFVSYFIISFYKLAFSNTKTIEGENALT